MRCGFESAYNGLQQDIKLFNTILFEELLVYLLYSTIGQIVIGLLGILEPQNIILSVVAYERRMQLLFKDFC